MRKTIKVLPIRFIQMTLLAFATLVLAGITATPTKAGNSDDENEFKFKMVRNDALNANFPNFLPDARGRVKIESVGPVEIMDVKVEGLPPNTDFDFFVIQVPKAPFGLSWYQGDIETNQRGVGHGSFIGRFSIETFIVAPGVSNKAPIVFSNPRHPEFSDTNVNPQTQPVHQYHLGLWFNSPQDAKNAGGPDTETPFNGEHNAGVQILNTSNFPDEFGPLGHVQP
jgi:hypothetical protein